MNPIKSIISRRGNYLIKNFEKSRHGKKLKALKDIHKGEKCFIVGNGPSLDTKDLDALQKSGIICFGMNRIFKIFEDTIWRPTYYACEDFYIFNDCIKEIEAVPAKLKFVPINHKVYNNIKVKKALYFFANYVRENDFEYSFSTNIAKQIDSVGTVTFICMTIAAYMGFEEIYLLGIDHYYHIIIDENGDTIVDDDAKDYFCDDYDTDIQDTVVHNMGQNTVFYKKAKKYCDKNGIKIFNATRGGKLEIFPRVNFDDIVK